MWRNISDQHKQQGRIWESIPECTTLRANNHCADVKKIKNTVWLTLPAEPPAVKNVCVHAEPWVSSVVIRAAAKTGGKSTERRRKKKPRGELNNRGGVELLWGPGPLGSAAFWQFNEQLKYKPAEGYCDSEVHAGMLTCSMISQLLPANPNATFEAIIF